MQIKQIKCLEQNISTLSGKPLEFVNQFTYFSDNISSTESEVSIRLAKVWTAFDRLSIIWKFDLSDKIIRDFFQSVAMSKVLYGCIILTLTKHTEKKLNKNNTYVLSWTNPGSNTPQNSSCTATRHMSHCWRIKDDLVSDILLWTPARGRASVCWLALCRHKMQPRRPSGSDG